MHTVKEAAMITGLTEHAVRFYTDKGLVPSVQRNKNNICLFDEESINWLFGVKCLRQSGMPIEDIKTYVNLCLEGDSTIPQRYTLLMEHNRPARRSQTAHCPFGTKNRPISSHSGAPLF
ncbi:HTH-type transcriptional regulator AdhR [Bacillus velezensis]|nr:HTH-type transcriptional regulator AdhR [Bacillus velezensis]